MDLVAVPDFPMRGMENWGLTMYSKSSLLLDEETSSAANKQAVTENVQHELAHQWFGNLVTMNYWDGLWLNEGFARWMAWYACDHFYPEWKVWDGYVATNLRSALGADGLRSSHPVEVPVTRDDQINQIFDDIAYEKGSAVIRMISKHLGEDVFMNGVRAYLKKHAYGSTTTNDLWVALSEVSGKDVEKIAGTWTKKVGYPVVAVAEDENQKEIHVKQNRFLATGDVKPEEDEILYPVSLGLHDKNGVDEAMAFDTREATFPIADGEFFKLNAEHSGFYRTLYSSKRLNKLGQNAKDGLLPISDRAGLISDVGALAEAGYQKTSDLLSLLASFVDEPECEVWFEIYTRLKSLKAVCLFEDEQLTDGLEAFQRSIVSPRAHQLGWVFSSKDGHVEQRFKALMFAAACSAGDESAKSAAFEMFGKFIEGDRHAIHSNVRLAVYKTVMRYGGEAEYGAIFEEYKKSTIPDEREDLLECLGATRNLKLLQRTTDLLLSGELNPQHIFSAIQGFKDHKDGVLALWAWMSDNWEVLYQIGHAVVGFGVLVFVAVAPFTKDHQRQMVQEFFKEKDTKVFDMNLAQALDVIRSKDGWLARDKADIEEWLSNHGYLQREP
ncbi:aminopeptidase [Xylariales sp. PMI_506]|nr:aminopeptidase [Xylariales sp. PMI_506]